MATRINYVTSTPKGLRITYSPNGWNQEEAIVMNASMVEKDLFKNTNTETCINKPSQSDDKSKSRSDNT
jgi:DNA-directed RNA polymerase beta subunit